MVILEAGRDGVWRFATLMLASSRGCEVALNCTNSSSLFEIPSLEEWEGFGDGIVSISKRNLVWVVDGWKEVALAVGQVFLMELKDSLDCLQSPTAGG